MTDLRAMLVILASIPFAKRERTAIIADSDDVKENRAMPRPRPYTEEQVEAVENEIKRLHNNGLSMRAISRRVNVPRNVVSDIIRGRRDSIARKKRRDRTIASNKPAALRTAYRCSGCGQRVYLTPCLICASRGRTNDDSSSDCSGGDR